MRQASPIPTTEPVDCAVCLQEIPASEAQSSEARDYVAGFCGLACYAQWQALGEKALQAEFPDLAESKSERRIAT